MKKYILPILVAVVSLGGITAVSAYAQSTTSTPVEAQDHVFVKHNSGLVKKIAERFGLQEAEVQKVFDEEHATRQAEMKQKHEDRLNQAVKDGKITEAQKNLILQKGEELKSSMKSEMESFKNMTDEERKAAMLKKHEELQAWAKQNGIPEEFLMFQHKIGAGNGKFMMKIN